MKVKVMCRLGDLAEEMTVEEAEAVFDRFTGKKTDLPQALVDRLGDRVKAVPGLTTGAKLNYLVCRQSDHAVIKRFSDFKPEDDILLMPPQVGG